MVNMFLPNEHHYELHYINGLSYTIYTIPYKNSKAITKILFLKGIKLEDFIPMEIDEDTYNIIYPYTFGGRKWSRKSCIE